MTQQDDSSPASARQSDANGPEALRQPGNATDAHSFREVGIIRNPMPNDVLVISVPHSASPALIDHIGETTRERLGCRVVVVTHDVRVGDDGATAELAALKARRCDGCECFMDADHAITGYGYCLLPNLRQDGPLTTDLGHPVPQVRPDHACNAWTPKEGA